MFPRAKGKAHHSSNWWTALYESSPLLQLVDCTVWIIVQVTTECVVEQNLRVRCGKASGLFDRNYMQSHCYKRKKVNELESVFISKDHLSRDSHCKHNTASRQSYHE